MLIDIDGQLPIIPIIVIGIPIAVLPEKIVDAHTASRACEEAKENYEKWMKDPRLSRHPKWLTLAEQAYAEYRSACFDKTEGAACKLTEAGKAINDAIPVSSRSGYRSPYIRPVPVAPEPINPIARDPIPPPIGLP